MLFGCVIVISLLMINYTHVKLNEKAISISKTNKERIERLDQMLILVLDAETSARGYMLMRSDPYLEPYRNSAIELEKLTLKMNSDYPTGSPHNQEFMIVKSLIQSKFMQMGEVLSKGKVPTSLPQDATELGKKLMDEIRLRLNNLKKQQILIHSQLESNFFDRLNNIQYAVYALGVAALMLLLSLFYVQQRQVVLRSKIQSLLQTENSRLESAVQNRTHELNDLASYLTNAREEERQHLARELHDEMGSLLTVAKMDASWLLRSFGNTAEPPIQERFRRLIEGIGSTISLKRRIIDDLRPPLLQGLGLVEALRALADSFKLDTPIQTRLPEADLKLSDDQSLALFRIAQESLTNIRKYAKASQVLLELTATEKQICLKIQDNGIGFDHINLKTSGHGIVGMRHRTQMFNGKLTLHSGPNAGTQVVATMPLIVINSESLVNQ